MTTLLFDRGFPIIAGTDNFTGFTVLRELELYAQAGIPTIDVLRIATLNAAKVVGQDAKTGSINEGKYADLVLYTCLEHLFIQSTYCPNVSIVSI